MSNRGTKEGTVEEKLFVKTVNKNPGKYSSILKIDCKDFLLVRVSYHVYGIIQEKKIFPKADAYAICVKNKDIYSKLDDHYICERDLDEYKENDDYIKIPHTGISIKLIDSPKYQITKINPSTFEKIFSDIELGAGASIYCRREDEIWKNDSVLNGWGVKKEQFVKYFEIKLGKEVNLEDTETLQDIKTFSNTKINNEVKSNKALSDYIFRGLGNFPEPYTASFIFEKNRLREINLIPDFKVTTGSGRSKGDFTIVIKPC